MSLLTSQHSRTTGVLLAGILTSLYSSGSVSHEQDNSHGHGNCNCDRVVRERGSLLIHKIWRAGQEQDHVIRIVQSAQDRQQDVTGENTQRGIQQEGTGECTGW